MRLQRSAIVALALLLAAPASLAPARDDPERPAPPLALTEPPAPPKSWEGNDLTELTATSLRGAARAALADDNIEAAIQFQHWAAAAEPGEGLYDLACFYARAKKLEAALYWLQRAGIEEGVDLEWAAQDADLAAVRADPRWEKLTPYLDACAAFWRKSGTRREVVTLPDGYDGNVPIPVIVGLHGLGSRPEDFAGSEDDQRLADSLGVALVGVSGTDPRGPNSFVWSEDVARDAAHVAAALERVSDRVKVRPGRVVLIGFSQGAQLAVELAARDPERYAGVIALCPGFRGESQLGAVEPGEAHARLSCFIVSGTDESRGNRILAGKDARWLREAKALVVHHVYRGMGHTFPPGYYDNLSIWVQVILGLSEKSR